MELTKVVAALGLAAGVFACTPSGDKAANDSEAGSAPVSEFIGKIDALHKEMRELAKARSTPDEAVRSFLEIAERRRKEDCYFRQVQYSSENRLSAEKAAAHRETYLALLSGRMADALRDDYEPDDLKQCLDRLGTSYEIRGISGETATSATVEVHLKNTAPIPPGAGGGPDGPQLLERRNKGELIRYQLEKQSEGWAITQSLDYNEQTGGWVPYFKDEDFGPYMPWMVIPF